MNVNDGTITSSPGPTPIAARARCRPVVQEVVAMPCCAPTYVATAFSNSATFGPCVTQPLLIDSDVAPGDLEEKAGELAHAGLHAGADVHDRVRSARLGGQHVRAHDVVDVHEVRGGRSVTEEHDRLALVDEIEPPDHHLEVLRADVLPRAVNIEVAQGGGR